MEEITTNPNNIMAMPLADFPQEITLRTASINRKVIKAQNKNNPTGCLDQNVSEEVIPARKR